MTNIFDAYQDRPQIKLTPEAEMALVIRAKSGDNPAVEQLIVNYLPLMKRAVSAHLGSARSAGVVPRSDLVDDLASACIMIFFKVLGQWEASPTHQRLAGLLQFRLEHGLRDEMATDLPMRLPADARAGYAKAMKLANYDRDLAREMARTRTDISPALFDAVERTYALAASPVTLDDRIAEARVASNERTMVRVEHLADVARGLDALDARERLVIETMYGIGGAEGMNDRQASAVLGIPRSTVRRVHALALQKMQSVLA